MQDNNIINQENTELKKKGLGRGLAALMPDAEQKDAPGLMIAAVKDIQPNRQQPRRNFDPDELAELTESIKEKGIIQPLVVRQIAGGYELIAGERRLRAAQLAGFMEVPVRVMEVVSDIEMLELSLIENLQRADLNAVELAEGYRKLQQGWGMTQEQIAQKVGKDRTTITNMLRLLELPPHVLDGLKNNEISVGHAKAILSVEGKAQRSALFKRIASDGLSVRQTEEVARHVGQGFDKRQVVRKPLPPHIQHFTDNLRRGLGTKVQINKKGQRGSIRIEFYSDEDLQRLVELMLGVK